MKRAFRATMFTVLLAALCIAVIVPAYAGAEGRKNTAAVLTAATVLSAINGDDKTTLALGLASAVAWSSYDDAKNKEYRYSYGQYNYDSRDRNNYGRNDYNNSYDRYNQNRDYDKNRKPGNVFVNRTDSRYVKGGYYDKNNQYDKSRDYSKDNKDAKNGYNKQSKDRMDNGRRLNTKVDKSNNDRSRNQDGNDNRNR